MLNHIMIGTNDIEKAKTFYNTFLGVLGAGAPRSALSAIHQSR